MKEDSFIAWPLIRSSKQHTFSYTGNKVGPGRKMEALVVDDDPHICRSADLKFVTLLTKVSREYFVFFFGYP
jgi:hypothetical protein